MRHGSLRGVMLLGVLVWSQVALAQAYNYFNFRMLNTKDNPFVYYVDSRYPQPAGIQLSLVETAVKNAFQTWDNVSCATTSFSYAGPSKPTVAEPRTLNDRYNVAAVWITDKEDPLYRNNLGTRPFLAVPLYYGGHLSQCDILLNGTGDIKWSVTTPTQAGYYDLQTYLLQAVGFCQGLNVTYEETSAVMFNELPVGGNRRTLTTYDINLLCNRYPTTPNYVSAPCSSTNTCTNGLTCVTPQSTGGKVAYNFCTKGCTNTTPGECPDPFVCKPSTAVPGFQYACLPADSSTQVGNACTQDLNCGSAYGFCQQPVLLPSSGTAWYGGYCSEMCGSGVGTCPTGSVCTQVSSTANMCLDQCNTLADCRDGYVCASQPGGNLCISKCYSDADCGSGFACRICEGVCAPVRNSGVVIGDACNDDAQCGTGQLCLKVNGHPQGFCSQTCAGTTTCSCPEGSSCQTVGPNRTTMCVRSCTALTCASGLQCAPFPDGTSGCLPSCRTQDDCPGGSTCNAGQCVGSGSYDGGSCPLCPGPGSPDAGTGPNPSPTDGGTGSGGSAGPGCGCQGSAVNAPGFLGALALFLVAARRRRCQRP
ncbi:adhesin [Archangium violaceum]|uniref:dickkopf-related protein n=1 Tax=Archangium violaceum TaxID=83451 RepID=UPI001951AAC8|nr:dickkopf-related protein [Archangium violaceum]QRN94280.1 adhesin [Archangium violaceum]